MCSLAEQVALNQDAKFCSACTQTHLVIRLQGGRVGRTLTAGLPPILIQVSSHEALLDDSLRLLRAATLADVPVEIKIYQGLPHVWQLFAGILDEGQSAIEEAGRFVDTHLKTTMSE
ncbi:alpha/beta hydrolase [Sphingomonas sp. TX0543]|uniref:alpha/beta hydrolase n=1 Tax=Sphingomonas sp. TX0543 TaxID=3399682 RepID=UPI003AFA1F2F